MWLGRISWAFSAPTAVMITVASTETGIASNYRQPVQDSFKKSQSTMIKKMNIFHVFIFHISFQQKFWINMENFMNQNRPPGGARYSLKQFVSENLFHSTGEKTHHGNLTTYIIHSYIHSFLFINLNGIKFKFILRLPFSSFCDDTWKQKQMISITEQEKICYFLVFEIINEYFIGQKKLFSLVNVLE